MDLKSLRHRYPAAFGLAVALAAAAAIALLPAIGDVRVDDAVRTGVEALLAGGLYALSGGSALPAEPGEGDPRRRRPLAGPSEDGRDDPRRRRPSEGLGEGDPRRRRPAAVVVVVVVAMLAYAAVACAVGFALGGRDWQAMTPSFVGLLALSCAATGVFEEALFRGFFFEGFAQELADTSAASALSKAALVSSVLFGILHIVHGVPAAALVAGVLWMPLKFAEATAFGLAMCYLRVRGLPVGALAALHACFDFLYFFGVLP